MLDTRAIATISPRYLDWADYMYTVQLKSTMVKAPPGGVATSRCLTIALFSIHPLELICCLPIDKQVSSYTLQLLRSRGTMGLLPLLCAAVFCVNMCALLFLC